MSRTSTLSLPYGRVAHTRVLQCVQFFIAAPNGDSGNKGAAEEFL